MNWLTVSVGVSLGAAAVILDDGRAFGPCFFAMLGSYGLGLAVGMLERKK